MGLGSQQSLDIGLHIAPCLVSSVVEHCLGTTEAPSSILGLGSSAVVCFGHTHQTWLQMAG